MAEKMKNRYFFPDLVAKTMSKISLRVQLESTLVSTALILGGLILSMVYAVGYIELPLWYKIVLVINVIAGFFFLLSHMISTFQQYQNVMEILDFQKEEKEMKGGQIENAENKNET